MVLPLSVYLNQADLVTIYSKSTCRGTYEYIKI